MATQITLQFTLNPADNQRLMILCGQNNENISFIENRLQISINSRGHDFTLKGTKEPLARGKKIIEKLYEMTKHHKYISSEDLHLILHANKHAHPSHLDDNIAIHIKRNTIKTYSNNQKTYLKNILSNDICFGIGPAGTGKTYLAIACAVESLEKDRIRQIVLVRPAVEAGERLGFLPGDLAQKVDPYLRPLYDALYEMLGFERVNKLLEKNIIEVAPLAYMRGRTLNHSFIILDESQNTTAEQMKMFLTRIGFNSKAVITGDITQVDLGQNYRSGLLHVIDVLNDIKGINFTFFDSKDVVRHPLVQNIVEAYARYEQNK